MDLGIQGKRALVMGASEGLGYAIAAALVDEGAKVAICSRDKERIEAAGRAVGAEAALVCDLSQPEAGSRLVKEATASLAGDVDILVCNTGGPPKGDFQEIGAEQWRQYFQGLWLSVVDSVQAALPGMRERKWGRILVVTSLTAKEPTPGFTISNGLRAGLLGLINSLSREVAADNVTVNSIMPGYIDTKRLRDLNIPAAMISAQIPAGRLGRPEELAAAAAFLASERASYITGQAILCDGGLSRGI